MVADVHGRRIPTVSIRPMRSNDGFKKTPPQGNPGAVNMLQMKPMRSKSHRESSSHSGATTTTSGDAGEAQEGQSARSGQCELVGDAFCTPVASVSILALEADRADEA